MSGPALAAALDPQTDLPLVDANGTPIPVFNLGKFIKGVVKVAVAVTAVAVTIVTGGSGAVIGAAIVAGLIAAEAGVQDIVAATMEASGCGPDAITCSAQRLCQVGMCSSGCCVNVGSSSSALVRARILSCATNADCDRGEYCNEGCCTLILPD
jgi:hypothetical protein